MKVFKVLFLSIHFSYYNLGAGGSIGFAVPSKNLSFAYVINQLDIRQTGRTFPRIQTILEKVATKISDNY